MDKLDFGIDEDSHTESSFSSNPFEISPYILNLHDISKEAPEQVKKIKKIKKRKKHRSQEEASVSSESTTNSVPEVVPALVPATIPSVVDEQPREEFYDAHESYHSLPENKISHIANPVAGVAIMQAHSEHGQIPKIENPEALAPEVQEGTLPTAITKPVTEPK